MSTRDADNASKIFRLNLTITTRQLIICSIMMAGPVYFTITNPSERLEASTLALAFW